MISLGCRMNQYKNDFSGDDDLYDYFKQRLGVNRATTITFLKTLAEYISLAACYGDEFAIKNIGKFSVKEGTNSLGFVCSRTIRDLIAGRKDKRQIVKSTDLISGEEKRKRLTNKNISALSSLRGCVDPDRRNNIFDQVRLSLAQYLQYRYTVKGAWRNPASNLSYRWGEVNRAIKIIKTFSKKDYALLLTFWTGITLRKEVLQKWGLDKKAYWEELERVLDAIVILLIAPKLDRREILSILGLDNEN